MVGEVETQRGQGREPFLDGADIGSGQDSIFHDLTLQLVAGPAILADFCPVLKPAKDKPEPHPCIALNGVIGTPTPVFSC